MSILILGSTGMLGSAVGKYFEKYKPVLTYRNKDISYGESIYFDHNTPLDNLKVRKFDYCINCIGVIKPFMKDNPIEAREINSIFPWRLANWCDENNIKLIHITTDCVFSGKTGKYTEQSPHDALDDYGKSKSLGEPTNAMVIRTSIIGEEIHKKASLIEWAKSQKGKEVRGFTNHYWNGITTNQYAKVCERIITDNLFEKKLFHVFTGDVNKYEMLSLFNKRFDLNLTIKEWEDKQVVDRTLRTTEFLCKKLYIPSVKEMIEQI